MLEYDQINRWLEALQGAALLNTNHEEFMLSAYPPGSRIRSVSTFAGRSGPPIKVLIAMPNGDETTALLRMSRTLDGVETEARLLPLLTRLGVPVPQLLAGPFYDREAPDVGAMSIISLLPGDNLQDLSFAEGVGVERASALVLEAVDCLHNVTLALERTSEANHLQRRSLLTELRDIVHRGGPWLSQPLIWSAVRQLMPVLARIDTPLAFSNGDYNPANFLSDGERLTGIIDFENACFEDPLYGFTKYPVYDMYPFYKTGLVEQYLERRYLTAADFAPRLAIRCLWTLQREIAPFPDGVQPQTWDEAIPMNREVVMDDYLRHVLTLLHDALEAI